MKHELSALISPLTLSEFLVRYRNNEPFVIHHDHSGLRELRDLAQVSSLNYMLESWIAPVQVHLPDLRDEASAIDVPASEAKNYFDQGMGLLFNDTHRFEPILDKWLNEIRTSLIS